MRGIDGNAIIGRREFKLLVARAGWTSRVQELAFSFSLRAFEASFEWKGHFMKDRGVASPQVDREGISA